MEIIIYVFFMFKYTLLAFQKITIFITTCVDIFRSCKKTFSLISGEQIYYIHNDHEISLYTLKKRI